MTGQQSIKEWTDYPLSFFAKKRKTEWLGRFSLTWHNFVIFAYLNYIMNFLKVNAWNLAKAKHKDTYVLPTFLFYQFFFL